MIMYSEIEAVVNSSVLKKEFDAAFPIVYSAGMSTEKTNRMRESEPLTHKHHIIPRHFGGLDHAWNIAELTVEEHAEAHRRLYEAFGSTHDKWAWKFLTWQATQDQKALKEAQRINAKQMQKARMEKYTPEERSAWSKKAYRAGLGKRTKAEHLAHYQLGIGKMTKAERLAHYQLTLGKITKEERSVIREKAYKAGLGKITKEERLVIYQRSLGKLTKEENRANGKKAYEVGLAKRTKAERLAHYQLTLGKMTKAERSAISKMSKGMGWYNNGEKETRCFPGTEPDGFIRGRINSKRRRRK